MIFFSVFETERSWYEFIYKFISTETSPGASATQEQTEPKGWIDFAAIWTSSPSVEKDNRRWGDPQRGRTGLSLACDRNAQFKLSFSWVFYFHFFSVKYFYCKLGGVRLKATCGSMNDDHVSCTIYIYKIYIGVFVFSVLLNWYALSS